MRFSTVAAAAALATGAAANYNSTYYEPSYTTEVVTEYTSYCPSPTVITHSDMTYTVTEATTLTFECPCTVTYPVTSPTYAPPPTTYAPPPPATTYAPPPYSNGTTTYAPPAPVPSSPTPYVPPPSASPLPGAANRAVAASGASLAAVLGFVAYVL